ncbi:MAG: hypothetical protein OEV87_13305 [Phycisphaerae bacterium]|nr:hypothetical protein [Phycisphaerae bacterium]
MSSEPKKSEFQIAEDVTKLLRDLNPKDQERILRWVSESIGIPELAQQHSTPSPLGLPQTKVIEDATARTTDLRSFYAEKQPKNDIHFAALVAYFYRFLAPEPDRKDTINAKDLEEATRLAQRDRFKTPRIPLDNAEKQGYLDRAGNGQFRINAVGENLVAMTLPTTSGGGGKRKGPRKKTTTAGKNKKSTVKGKSATSKKQTRKS